MDFCPGQLPNLMKNGPFRSQSAFNKCVYVLKGEIKSYCNFTKYRNIPLKQAVWK